MSLQQSPGAVNLREVARQYVEALLESARAGGAPRTELGRPTPQVGDVWSTAAPPGQMPVLIAMTWVGDEICRGVPLLHEVHLAASDDMIVPSEDSPTESSLALCTWRDTPLAFETLAELIGPLPDDLIDALLMALQHSLTGGYRRTLIGSERLATGEPALRWRIEAEEPESTALPAVEFLSGAPLIREDDPRLEVRAALERLTEFLPLSALETLPVEQAAEAPIWGRIRRLADLSLSPFALISRTATPVLSGDAPSSTTYQTYTTQLPDFQGMEAFKGLRLTLRTGQKMQLMAELELEPDVAVPAIQLDVQLRIDAKGSGSLPRLIIKPKRSLASQELSIPSIPSPSSAQLLLTLTAKPDLDAQED